MKINFYLFICCLLSLTACSDYLDVSDELAGGMTSVDEVFNNVSDTRKWYGNVFSGVPDYSSMISEKDYWDEKDAGVLNPWTSLADECWTYGITHTGMSIYEWNSKTRAIHRWTYLYQLIRQANIFLEKAKAIDATGINAEFLTEEDVALYKSNVRFMRALYYYLLLEQYGPVPLVTKSLSLSDDLDIERRPLDEIVEFIDTELLEASTGMYQSAQTDENFLAVPTKGAALALRAKLWVFAASPLYNGGFTEALALPRTSDDKALFSPKDDSKWTKATAACKEFIDFAEQGNYSLYKAYTNSVPDPEKSVYELFQVYNPEIIWATAKTGWGGTGSGFENRATPVSEPGGSGRFGVVQELVDDFAMSDGLPIKNTSYLPKSPLYVEDGSTDIYNGVPVNKMYLNREPRFYNTVFFNNRKWHISNRVIQFHMGGNNDRTNSTYTPTGYILYKRFNRTVHNTPPGVKSKFRPSIIFRLAEFYLFYAEALNETNPTHPDILKYVNLIRERAGLPNLEDLNPEIAGNQELQRDAIRMERRIELATEGQRYFDCHRWMIAGNAPGEGGEGGDFHGMNMDGNEENFYVRTKFETRIFRQKNYLFPVPLTEIQKSKEILVQNPGW